MEEIKMDRIEDAIADFKEGKFVIVVDDEDRENEGDLIIDAEKITPEKVNFMLKHARGVLCAPVTVSRCKELDLPHQVSDNTSVLGTPFTVTIDKLEGCSTGVSAADRAATIQHWLILLLHRPLSDVPDILIRCTHRKKEYFAVPDIQRQRLTWHVWPAFIRQVL